MSNLMPYLKPSAFRALIGGALLSVVAVGCGNPAPAPPAAKPAAAPVSPAAVALATNDLASQYISVFEDLPPPQGKDPFFPRSHRRDPKPAAASQAPIGMAAEPAAAILVLKGVVGSKSRRLALINSETMAVGDTASVRVADGRVRVRCLEIGPDYVLLNVEGEEQPKRLELGK